MAIAKTTKSAPAAKPPVAKSVAAKPVAAKPAAAKSAAPKSAAAKSTAPKPAAPKPAAAKPAPAARAAESKPDEKAVVHSAEIMPDQPAKPAPHPAEPAPNLAHAAIETVAKAAETMAEAAPVKPSKAVAAVTKATHDAGETVLKGVAPLIEFSRDNAILLVSTGNELALGWHKLSQSLIDWSAESCDKSVAAGQAILSAKTVEEVIDLSQTLAKDSLQHLLKEGSELSKLSTKLIEDTIAPLPVRLAAAVEKLAHHAA